jgi:heme exporter protein A
LQLISQISIDNVTCLRGGRIVFRDVSIRVGAGEVLAIEGANGSGKTSLLRMIAGFLAQQAGTISLRKDSAEISDGEERGKFVGWLGHQDGVKPQMTPAETLRFFAGFYGAFADTNAALDSVGLSRAADLPCRYLSAGQKKRLALARLKISTRPLWLLDEPLSALDTQGKSLLRDLIERHCASGGMIIAATHEPLDVDCARLVIA